MTETTIMAELLVTIDGPAASGKSTLARLLAERLGAVFLDTGAMYRAATLAAMQAKAELSDEGQLLKVLNNTNFNFEPKAGSMKVFIDGLDVTEQIRDENVTANARYIASAPLIRQRLVRMQRDFAAGRRAIVTEGRDQGTVVFPDADIKFYLTAEPGERAKRRRLELAAKGIERPVEVVKEAIERRDFSDENRTVGPLRPAEDAVVVDTTALSIEDVVAMLLERVREKCSG